MNRLERERVVRDFVQARLRLECRVRGRRLQIARKIGFVPSHLTHITKGERRVSMDLALALAEFWGLTFEELERQAFEAHGLRYSPEPAKEDVPNLRETIAFCRQGKVYPARFLGRYEKEAEKAGVDRSCREWLLDIEAAHEKWAAEREQQGLPRSRRKRGVRARGQRSGVHTVSDLSESNEGTDVGGSPKSRTAG